MRVIHHALLGERRALPFWRLLIQAHRPDLMIVRSGTRYEDHAWV